MLSIPDPRYASGSDPDRLLGAAEVADILGTSPRWIEEHSRLGDFPGMKVGRYWRYHRGDVLDWIERKRAA